MNIFSNISNNGNQTYLSIDEIFELYGSTWLKDALCFFVCLPLSFIGIVLNSTSWLVLKRDKFLSNTFYSYLRFYTINSIFICFIQVLFVSGQSFRYFSFSYKSPILGYCTSFIYIPSINIFILFAVLLEICISIERNAQFSEKNKFKCILKHKAKNVCILLFVFSFVISSQHFFIGRPSNNVHKLDSNTTIEINFFKMTNFSKSVSGMIINSIEYFFRDVVLLIVQIILNVISIHLLRKQIKTKNDLHQKSSENASKLLKKKSFIKQTSKSSDKNVKHFKIAGIITKAEQNLTIMVVIMTFTTVLEHLFLLLMIYFVTINEDKNSFLISAISNIFISIKYSSNFFIFYSFNRNFKFELNNLLKHS